MSKVKIEVKDLTNTIDEYLNTYYENIEDYVKDSATDISKKAVEKLKKRSPDSGFARKNKYKEGWTSSSRIDRNNSRYVKIIHNKTNPSLPHLLEFPHSTRNGKLTKAQPHIRDVENESKLEFEKELEEKIKKGN